MASLLVLVFPFRLRRLDRRTQGHAEAAVGRAVRRDARVAVRRPAIRRDVEPTAATVHAGRAPFGYHRIHYVAFFIVTKVPVMRPLEQVTVHVIQATNARTKFPGRVTVLATVLLKPSKTPK